MTKESENAAKWEIVEKYQEANKLLAVLGHRCKEIGTAISVFGHAVSEHPESVKVTEEGATYPKYAGAPAYERNKNETDALQAADYSLDNLKSLVDEYRTTLKSKGEALQNLRELGINPGS